MHVEWANYWNNMRFQYNFNAVLEGWETLPEGTDLIGNSKIECVVTQMLDRTYGKMPDAGADSQIIMEYKYYTDTLAN